MDGDRGAGASWTAVIEVQGRPDPRTGYLVGIDRIDAAVRESALPRLLPRHAEGELSVPEALEILHRAVSEQLDPPPSAAMLSTEPMTWWRIESESMSTMRLRRRYEFSASHRLHLPELDDAARKLDDASGLRAAAADPVDDVPVQTPHANCKQDVCIELADALIAGE